MQALIQTPKTPLWLALAATQLGVSEIKGAQHRAEILQYWRKIKRGGIVNDETPWCAAFVGAMLEMSSIESTRFESAASYMLWGRRLALPVQGAIAVLDHHVAFVAGIRSDGRIMLLGGNQGDAVTIAAFSDKAIKSYRWPKGANGSDYPYPRTALPAYPMPIIADAGKVKIT
jgi:uncharacterized protein (TIGR02594 family)